MLFVGFLLISLAYALIPKKDFVPDVFVLTDISNEPDDAQSLVRLLLYSNELNIKGIVATTSFWLNYTVHDEDIYPILDAYEKVHKNLLKHSPDYPTADYFRSIVGKGSKRYGLAALELEELSEGAANLIESVDSTPDTIYVLMWGGANVLAEALNKVSQTRSQLQVDEFCQKIVVYSISDQDNAGPWIRKFYPLIKYIASVHGFNMYGHSSWVGISGDVYNCVDTGGPDSSLVSKEWAANNVQSVGALGKVYPDIMFNMEGDTPSTLYVLPNGLGDPSEPSYGSWGGRYTLSDISLVSGHHYGDALDYAIGVNNETFVSGKATIWKWRPAFQNDFAGRMQWTVKKFKDASHQPIIVVNETTSYLPTSLEVDCDSTVTLDASKSYDLNGKNLKYKWYHYREPSLNQGNIDELEEIQISKVNDEGSIVTFQTPSFKKSCYNLFGRPLGHCKTYHIVLEVTNDGTPSLTTYRRYLIKPQMGDNVYEEAEYKQSFFNADNAQVVHDEL